MTFIPAARLLPAAAGRSRADDRRSGARSGFAALLLPRRRLGHRSPLEGARRVRRSCSSWAASRRRAASRQAFFPKDLSYLSYVDVWLPEDATVPAHARRRRARSRPTIRERGRGVRHASTPRRAASRARRPRVAHHVRRRRRAALLVLGRAGAAAAQLRAAHRPGAGQARHRAPRRPAPGGALASASPGARIDVRQLETGKPVGIPVAVRISGRGHRRRCARSPRQAEAILRATPHCRPRARRLGRRELHREARGRPRSRQPRRRHEPRRGARRRPPA